jgi:hypothetical protein
MTQADFYVGYNWSAENMTIGEGMINFTDDTGAQNIIWQNYSHDTTSGILWMNYTIDENEQGNFLNDTRAIKLRTYSTGISNAYGNVSISQIGYIWKSGKLFEESQELFVKVKVYDYVSLLGTPYLYINGTAKTIGGWGENFRFNVTVKDRFSRNVSIYGWHKTTGSYVLVGNWNCTNCGSLTEANFTYDYNGTEKGAWIFKFNATNPDGGNESSTLGYTVEADDVNANYLYPGNNGTVNRSQATNFSINIWDTDNASAPGYLMSDGVDKEKGRIYLSKFASNETFYTSVGLNTNNSGAIYLQMKNIITEWCESDAGADYPLGQRWFYGGITGASTYKTNITLDNVGIRPFMLVGDMYIGYFSPQTTNYTLGSAIPLQAYISDDCGNNVTDAVMVFNLTTAGYSTTKTVAKGATSDTYENLTYTLPAAAPLGWYNVSVITNRTNYWNGTFSQTNAFYYGTAISLTNQNMTPYIAGTGYGGGWGESPFRFNVTITNNQSTAAYLWLWNSGWSYEYNNNCTAPDCINYNISYQKNFSCANRGNWAFRYNATDESGVVNNTLGNISFIVERDDILVQHYSGNNSYVNRSENEVGTTTRLATRINDTDARNFTTDIDNKTELYTYIYNGTEWITENELRNATNGTYYLDFNPSCDFNATQHIWNMTTAGAGCFKNISSVNFQVNVIGSLKANYTSPTGLVVYERGNNIVFSGNVTDDCDSLVTGANVQYQINSSQATYYCNQTAGYNVNFDTTIPGFYNCTWDSSGRNVSYYNVTMLVTKPYNLNSQDTELNAFKIKSTQVLSGAFANPMDEGWSLNRTFYMNVTDNAGDNVTAWLWSSTDQSTWTQIGTPRSCNETCSNTTLSWNNSYACINLGTIYFKFNATDLEGNVYSTTGTNYVGSDNNFVIQADNIRIDYIYGNETNSTNTNSTMLIVRIYDTDKNTNLIYPAASVAFNITTQGIGSANYTMLVNTTNSTGEAEYAFYANTTFGAAKQYWFAVIPSSETCYLYNLSRTFNVTTLSNQPVLSSQIANPISGGWGDSRVFNVTVYDPNNTATVYLWKAESTSGPWTYLDTQSYTNTGISDNLTFTYQSSCSDLATGGANKTWYFKFNSSNAVGNIYSTVPSANDNFSLSKDFISLVGIIGNDTIANRTGTQYDFLSVNVKDNNGSIVQTIPVIFTITRDGTNWDSGTTNNTNSTGDAEYSFNPICSPKYYVGIQKWQANVSGQTCYVNNGTNTQQLTVMGDINITFNTPDGTRNFTQETDTIDFLGSSVDDCGDSLTLNTTINEVVYYVFNGSDNFNCNSTAPVSQIGANAYSCKMVTNLTSLPKGWYNTTMNSSRVYHYNASVYKNSTNPGLFYLFVKRNLGTSLAIPNSSGWGYPNWNFSIIVSSGDPTVTDNITLHIGTGWPPGVAEECTSTTCVNGTAVLCTGCQNALTWWQRNWTYNQMGTWYYRFKLGGIFEDTIKSVILTKDNTNITYGDSGNNTQVTIDSNAQVLRARVYDIDKGSYNVTVPSATVGFYLWHAGYSPSNNYEKYIGNNVTNSSGYAEFSFNFSECEGWQDGVQNWFTRINSTEPYYNTSTSINYTVELIKTGCTANVGVDSILVPEEAFQYRNFTVNATITSWKDSAYNVTAFMNATQDTWVNWIIGNSTRFLGTIGMNSYTAFFWTVNATTSGTNFKMSLFANSTNAKNDTKNSSAFIVYNDYNEKHSISPTPIILQTTNETILSWKCNVSDYRIGTLNLTLNTSSPTTTIIRVSTYDGTIWRDVMHNQIINTTGLFGSIYVPILKSEIFPNGTGYCNIKVKNIGTENISIINATLRMYHLQDVKIQDIVPYYESSVTTGLETSETSFNVSIKIGNDLPSNYSVSVALNITNSTGSVIYNATNLDVNATANSTITSNFTNINTTLWFQGDYKLNAYVLGTQEDSRVEDFIFKNVTSSMRTGSDYMCNGTTEWLNFTFNNPYNDSISYNISLELPANWIYSGSQIINATSQENYTVGFNITSSSNNEQAQINVSLNYTYPGINKVRKISKTVENNHSIPILEIVRETPKIIGPNTVFDAQISVHNKGCAATTTETIVKEVLSTGWNPANPLVLGEVSLQTTGTGTDLINNIITWNLSTIGINKYAILIYQVKSPNSYSTSGNLRYNATWNQRALQEYSLFNVQTLNYTGEPHLEFDLEAIQQQGDFPWLETRSAQLSKHYNYSLEVKNIGAGTATGWNVSMNIPVDCNISQVYSGGNWDEPTRKIRWNMTDLEIYSANYLNFTMNCTGEGKHVLLATGTKNTTIFNYTSASTSISAVGANAANSSNYNFSKPAGVRYERMTQADFYVGYNWSAENMTIGEGMINFTDDTGAQNIIWQNYSHDATSGILWMNYTIDESEQGNFLNDTRAIKLRTYSTGISNAYGNVSISQIGYIWKSGKLFEESQELFVNVKPYIFTPSTPILSSPGNNSNVYSEPVVLSWTAISGPDVSYYVYGNAIDGTTFLANVSDNFYLWRGLSSDTYYWKVKATTQNGLRNSSDSETRQFSLDLCAPDTSYAYANNFPMSYNNATDTITVWGSNGDDGYTAMGNLTNPITFQQIYNFSRAVRGICAATNPATGTYAILTNLTIGNTSSSLNTTYLKTFGESISFSQQVVIKFNSTFISGRLSPEGNPFAGSTLSFSGTGASLIQPGELALENDSYIELYDTMMLHKVARQYEPPWFLIWYGDVVIKRSSFQNWEGLALRSNNNTLDDVVFTDVIHGLHPDVNQTGTMQNIISRFADHVAIHFRSTYAQGNNMTITNLQISETNMSDIEVENYTGIANLINPTLNWSSIEWGNGTFSGVLNRKYTYGLTTADSIGIALANVSTKMIDVKGSTLFNLVSSTSGTIPQQTITRGIYDYTYKTGNEQGPHRLYLKKYGKIFSQVVKEFSAATLETIQLSDNPFTDLSEAAVLTISGINYNAPTKINYKEESNVSYEYAGSLLHSPVTQSEFFGIFANGTKLIEGVTNNYTISYTTGAIIFIQNMSIYNVTPVYSYGGNITIVTGTAEANCINMSALYSYMQYNLSDVLTTVDGSAYTSYVNLIIGNATIGGCIKDADAGLSFEDGYTYSFSTVGGYIDLYGVTAGAGTGGGLPLNIFDDVGSQYNPGNMVYIFSTTLGSTGNLVSSVVNVSVYYSNGTLLASNLSTGISTGRFRYNFTLPASAPTGTYRAEIDATYGGNEVHDTIVFKVESASTGGGAYPEVIVSAPSIITTNANFSITALTESAIGVPINCVGGTNITIRDTLLGTNIVSNASMTNFATGQYNYTWSAENESTFLATVTCTITEIDYTGTTTFSTLGVPIEDGFVVDISDTGEISVGKAYNVKIWIYNNLGTPIDADIIPRISLITPQNITIFPNTAMIKDDTGIYTYTFGTAGYPAGTWESIANVTVNNVTVYPSEFWELESVYADVSNPTITDNTIPSITAQVYISNNGTASDDFEIAYCIVTTPENVCGGTDDVDTNAISQYFEPGEVRLVTFSGLKGLEVSTAGNYYFRVQVRPISATETAWGLSSFTAISAEVPPVVPPAGPSGGGGAPVTPRVIQPINKSYVFDIIVNVLDKYKELYAGDEIVAEIIISSSGQIKNIINADLEYYIENSKGEIFSVQREKININETTQLLRKIILPKDIGEGDYWYFVKVSYNNTGSIEKASFKVLKEKEEEPYVIKIPKKIPTIPVLIILLIVLIIIIFLIFRRKHKKDENVRYNKYRRVRSVGLERTKPDYIDFTHKKRGQDLNKLIDYIKG